MKRVFFEEIQPKISRIFYSQIAEDFFLATENACRSERFLCEIITYRVPKTHHNAITTNAMRP